MSPDQRQNEHLYVKLCNLKRAMESFKWKDTCASSVKANSALTRRLQEISSDRRSKASVTRKAELLASSNLKHEP
jgi:hypothetical protein